MKRSTSLSRRLSPPLRGQTGLSLIELMISLTIGLFLLLGLATLISQQTINHAEVEKSTLQIENGRYAMQLLREELQHAGFYGDYATAVVDKDPPLSAAPNPCAVDAATLDSALSMAVQGYDSPAAPPAVPTPGISDCLAAANHKPGTDILVIRRAGSTTLAPASAAAGQAYLQATTVSRVLGVGPSGTYTLTNKGAPAPLRPYYVYIYFISPCSVATGAGTPATCQATDDNGKPIPTLKRLELTAGGGGASFAMVSLVEGIEDLQFDYGLDTLPSGATDGAPDSYTTAPAYTTGSTPPSNEWINVTAVRVSLLARGTTESIGYTDTKSYTLGLTASTPSAADAKYKRRVFSELVRLVNPGGRRE